MYARHIFMFSSLSSPASFIRSRAKKHNHTTPATPHQPLKANQQLLFLFHYFRCGIGARSIKKILALYNSLYYAEGVIFLTCLFYTCVFIHFCCVFILFFSLSPLLYYLIFPFTGTSRIEYFYIFSGGVECLIHRNTK